jgi:hypothetical protein
MWRMLHSTFYPQPDSWHAEWQDIGHYYFLILLLYIILKRFETISPMKRTCDCTFNRKALLNSEVAVCLYCYRQFLPTEIIEWCDGNNYSSQTVISPHCGIDSVVGFNGSVDAEWVKERHQKSFGFA